MSMSVSSLAHSAETAAKAGLGRRLATLPKRLVQLPSFSKSWLKETITMMNSADPVIQKAATNRAVDMFYVVGFGSPLLNAIFNPVFMALKYKLGGMPNKDIKQQVGQEATVQWVGIASLGTAFFGLSQLSVMLLKRRLAGRPEVLEELLRPVRALSGNIGGALGFAFLRPLFGSIVFEKLYKKMKADDALSKSLNKHPASAANSSTPSQAIQKVGMVTSMAPGSLPVVRPGLPLAANTASAPSAVSPFQMPVTTVTAMPQQSFRQPPYWQAAPGSAVAP